MPSDQEVVDLLDQVWGTIDAFLLDLSEPDWKRPTECPGWSVQDHLAHLSGIESTLLGRPEPEHELPDELPHVKNDVGRRNERFVDARRSWSGEEVRAEFHEVTRARIDVLRAAGDAELSAESWTPVGPGTVRDLLPFRIFDSWVHEQDMRRAVGRPGDLDSPVAENGIERIVGAMPFVVGKKAGAPEGAVVEFALSGPLAREVAIAVVDGRARLVDASPSPPTTRLSMTTETFARLGCGRIDPGAALATGAVGLHGDADLGRRIVEEMNFLF